MKKNCLDFVALKNKLAKYKLLIISFIILLIFSTVVGVILIPRAFAQPVKSIQITSSEMDYEKKDPGAWKVDKSAKWIGKGEAEITFDVDTIIKRNNKYTDILFVLDVSGSMDGDKLNRVKADSIELIDSLLSNGENRSGLITFDSTSNIVLDFNKDEELLKEKINSLVTKNNTNYYQALVNVDEVLKNYSKEKDRECVVLFLTDGYPNEDTPNEETQYNYLKQQYPFITINGIQYEMGTNILDPVKKVSDNQFVADMNTLNNVLFDASVTPITYDNFELTDYIDTNYFYVESEDDIKVSEGKVTFDKSAQTVNWKMDNLKSGQDVKMTIKARLKDELIGQGGVYPTNQKEKVVSKLEDIEEEIDSIKTPVLADNYRVIYEGNAPDGCSVSGIPDAENKSVFDVVGINDAKAKCEGYEFKGWKIATKDVEKVNDDYFIMPESDVVLKAKWGRVAIEKSMDGTISVAQTFYKMMKNLAVPDNEKSEFVSSTSGINFGSAASNTNGKGVYTLAATKNDEYPVLYYRGAVTNNNVKFGGFCWKIVRTTSTGGVKLIYRGKPDANGYCNANSTNATIGADGFNTNSSSPADVGYMYGNRTDYTYKSQYTPTWYKHIGRRDQSIDALEPEYFYGKRYYYGDTITWNSEADSYVISNNDGSEVVYTIFDNTTCNSFVGKYVCANGTASSCKSIYYIVVLANSMGHYINLDNGQTLEDANTTWNYGKDVVYENGVYTIQNPTEVKRADWSTEYRNYNGNYICSDGSSSCSTIGYIVSPYLTGARYIEMSNGETYDSLYQEALDTPWIYGNDIEWDGSKYILKDTYESSPLNWSNDWSTIATRYHYTCFSKEDNCSEVGYIHYFSNGLPIYHLKLKDGKTIEDAKKEMFTNTTDSKIKQTIDTWYQANMLKYTDSLEDTVWCNDRSIDRGPLKSKDENSSDTTRNTGNNYTYFGADVRNVRTYRPSLECENINDRFTVSETNGNGMLTYPVALLTADEMTLAGHGWKGNSSSYLYNSQQNWSLSPRFFEYRATRNFGLNQYSSMESFINDEYNAIRPSISLAPNSIIASGDGTATNPFTVEMNN